MLETRTRRSYVGKIAMAAAAALVLFGATVPASSPQAEGLCLGPVTVVTIQNPIEGTNYFENQYGSGPDGVPGNADDDGLVKILFSGSAFCSPEKMSSFNWYVDGKFIGSGINVYKTFSAGCETFAIHTAKFVYTSYEGTKVSDTNSFSTGAVC